MAVFCLPVSNLLSLTAQPCYNLRIMRAGFENYLHQLNDLSRDMARDDLSEADKAKISTVLDWHISKAAQRYGTPKETQEFVFAM